MAPINDKQIITIQLYRTRFCPRCALASRHLRALTAGHPQLRVEEKEILSDWRGATEAGIGMIPAIRVDTRVLSGIYLSRTAIARFLKETGCL